MVLLNLFLCALMAEAAVVRSPFATIEKRQSQGTGNGLGVPLGLGGKGFGGLGLDAGFIPLLPSGAQISRRTRVEPARSEDFKPRRFLQAKRKQVTWGPFELLPVNATHKTGQGGIKLDKFSDVIEETLGGFCQNCMLLDTHIDVSDKTGRVLVPKDEVYTHHIILGIYGKRTPPHHLRATGVCGDGKGGSRGLGLGAVQFQGAGPGGLPFLPGNFRDLMDSFNNTKMILVKGPEQNEINFASSDEKIPKSGVWLDRDEKLLISAEVVNYRNTPQNIYLTADIEYLEFDTKPSYLRTDMGTFLAVDCENTGMHPPADKAVTYESPVYAVDAPMYLLNLNPHLHDGATNMQIHVNGKMACDAQVMYGKSGGLTLNGKEWETINTTTPCNTLSLNKGDNFKITSEFDLTKHTLRPSSGNHAMGAEAMAIAFIQFAYPE